MRKHLLILAAICLLPVYMLAEAIPEGYYTDADGKKDAELKTALSLICRGGERYDYGTNSYHTSTKEGQWQAGDLKAYGTWQALPLTDMHPDGIVWDMYSNSVRYYPNKQGDSGCSLNIEHCFPKSWWGGEVNDAYKDLYHLNPSDQRANGQKSNYPPGHVVKGDKFDNGTFRMDSKDKSQYGWICFEPEKQYRGDFARAYFYIATAYEDYTWVESTSGFDVSVALDNDSYLEFKPWLIQVLLDWHREDPVSDKEICRADRISDIQHNRNPFIDYPDLVEYIWGEKKGQPINLASLSCTYKADACPDPVIPTPDPQKYDTLINLPAIVKNTVAGYTNGSIIGTESYIQSNGNSSITMGTSSNGGVISFSGLNLTRDAILAFRASPYNSATSMQLDVYADETLIQSIQVTVEQETRNEVRYRLDIPASAQSIKLESVGTSTAKRACMQELYLLTPREDAPTDISATQVDAAAPRKILRDGNLYIAVGERIYSILGK